MFSPFTQRKNSNTSNIISLCSTTHTTDEDIYTNVAIFARKSMYNFHLYLPIVTKSTYTQVLAIIAVISHHHPGKRYWHGA